MQKLGWIGLGNMGSPMALNLMESGYSLKVFNRTKSKRKILVEKGALACDDLKTLAQDCSTIILMVSNAKAVEEVLEGPDGLLEYLEPKQCLINMTTISPEDALNFESKVEKVGAMYIDAPVSGSTGAAKSRGLIMLTAGKSVAKEQADDVLKCLGKKKMDFGECGKASAAKLSINLLLGLMGEAFAESLLLAESSGVTKGDMLDLIEASPMNNTLYGLKKGMYAKEEFPPMFTVELMAKDMRLARELAQENRRDLPLMEKAFRIYEDTQENGKKALDMAAIYLELKEKKRID